MPDTLEVMADRPQLVPISDPSGVSEARRRAGEAAAALDFNEEDRGRVSLAATELASNIYKHAGAGSLVVGRLPWEGAVQLIAMDKGPGIRDVKLSLQDGYSTSGSSGTGLGALRRISDYLDIYSQPAAGTVAISWIRRRGARPRSFSPWEVGAVQAVHPGEVVCGDAWGARETAEGLTVLVADGLGHGTGAADAAAEAVRSFSRSEAGRPEAILKRVHEDLKSTRGAAVAVAAVPADGAELVFSGAGNIGALVSYGDGVEKRLVSLGGTVGADPLRIQSFTYPWEPGALLVLHSDGLASRLSLRPYPGLAERRPALAAAVLFRDYGRHRDDASVVCLRRRLPG